MLTLSPPGKAYYLPSQRQTRIPGRVASPDADLLHDSEVQEVSTAGDLILSKASSESQSNPASTPARSLSPDRPSKSKKGMRTSVGWPDLVKYVFGFMAFN